MGSLGKLFSRLNGWATAIDWRAIGRHIAAAVRLLVRAGYWTVRQLTRAGLWTARRAAHLARWAAPWLARWALRHPRRSAGAFFAVIAAVALVLVLRSGTEGDVTLSGNLNCLALNIYHEARGEPDRGKIAVAQVVMNRVADSSFPDTVCAVIEQGAVLTLNRCHFSWWCDGKSDHPDDTRAWEESKLLAGKILDGGLDDPTQGALWYHADYVEPTWRAGKAPGPKIGQHQFYARP